MIINNPDEHVQKMIEIYMIAHAHYVISSIENASFPNRCCTLSRENMLVTTLTYGCYNAAFVRDFDDNHSYNVFSFTMINPSMQGVVVLDPKSCQLWYIPNRTIKPRNVIFVTSSIPWKYETHWKYGSNLYPRHVIHIGTIHQHGSMPTNKEDMKPINSFFQKAFSNPLHINRIIYD